MSDTADIELGFESLKAFLAKIVQAVFGFVGTIIFARVLGPTDFGGFYFLLALVLIADRPLDGISMALKKRVSEPSTPSSSVLGAALIINLLFLAAAVLVVVALRSNLIAVTNIANADVVFISLLAALSVFYPIQKALAGVGRIGKQNWNDTLRSVLTLPLQLFFVLVIGVGAAGMGYGLAGATLLVVPVALYFLKIRPSRPTKTDFESIWQFARYSVLGTIVGRAYDRFDVLLLGAILTTGAVGYYETAYKLTIPASFLPGVVASGLLSKVSGMTAKEQDITSDIANAISYVSLFAIPIFFGAVAIAEPLVVTVYGPQYANAAAYLVGLALYQVITAQVGVFQAALDGLDRPDINLRLNTVTLVFNVVIGLVLITVVGGIGVVIATVIAESLRYGLSFFAVRSESTTIPLITRPVVEQIFAGVLMFVIVAGANWIINVQSWHDLFVLLSLGIVSYSGTLLIASPSLRVTLRAVYQQATH